MKIVWESLSVLRVSLLESFSQISNKLIFRAKFLLLFLLVFLESMLLIAEDEKKSIVLEFSLNNFEEAYFLAPDDLEALFGLAKALEEAERWRKARNYYRFRWRYSSKYRRKK